MIYPAKLKKGSHIRVIAPSTSFRIISEETKENALKVFAALGITVSYGKNTEEFDEFDSSSIKSRIEDLHDAFADQSVDGIFTAIGGFYSNQLLEHIDYDLIKKNPKILCGFSDITVLANAIHTKTGLVTYSGIHFSSFGMLKGLEYSIDYFKKCFMEDSAFEVVPSKTWSNDSWFRDQENREFIKNDGFWVMNKGNIGTIKGKVIGGNLGLLGELRETEYSPDIRDSILFIEHCSEDDFWSFSRSLHSLSQNVNFKYVKAIVIGRFEKANNVSREFLDRVIKSKVLIGDIPIIANVDFGHTTPIISFPIGGTAEIKSENDSITLRIINH